MLLLVKATVIVLSGHCRKINVVDADRILLSCQVCSPWQELHGAILLSIPHRTEQQHLWLLYGLKFLQPKTNNNNACMAGILGRDGGGKGHLRHKSERHVAALCVR